MKKQKGFTLIELLIVVAIMIIMLGVVLSMSRDDRDRQFVRASAEELIAAIREAQNGALTGNLINGQRPCSFSVKTSGSTYGVTASTYDSSDGSGNCENPLTPKTTLNLVPTRSLSGGVTLTTHPGTLLFRNQFAYLEFSSGDSEKYVLKAANSSLEYTICVHVSGRVDTLGFGNSTCS